MQRTLFPTLLSLLLGMSGALSGCTGAPPDDDDATADDDDPTADDEDEIDIPGRIRPVGFRPCLLSRTKLFNVSK